MRGQAPVATVDQIRTWTAIDTPRVDVAPIAREVEAGGDAALLALTARFDATERAAKALRVDPEALAEALAALDPGLRETIELAIANVRTVAAAQVDDEPLEVALPQGQSVTLREVAGERRRHLCARRSRQLPLERPYGRDAGPRGWGGAGWFWPRRQEQTAWSRISSWQPPHSAR